MRNRNVRIMLLLVVLSLAVGAGYSGLAGYKVYTRVYQHRSWMQPSKLPESEEELITHLPIISINTNGQDVPGERISYSEGDIKQYTLSEDGDTRIVTKFAMYDSGKANKLSDAPVVSSLARIRYRGNYSRKYHKKSYSVSLVMPDGDSENRQSLAGLSAHNEWVLDGLWIDRTLQRNYLAYNIAGEVMGYAPNVRFVELILNDEYQGVYLLAEPVTRGKGRLDLRKTEDGKDITSFIARWDRATKGDQKINNFTFYTYRSDLSALDVRYPGKQNFTPGRMTYIEESVSKIEKSLYSADLSDPRKGYRKYLDLDSFAHYFILNEFFRNTDAGRYSTFLYKDVRSKVGLVVWDFDNSADNGIDLKWDEFGFDMQNAPWFSMLLKDEIFVKKVIDEYHRLRKGPLAEKYLLRTIDETVTYLGGATARNYEKWDRAFDLTDYNGLDYLIPIERNYKSYEESVEQFKNFIEIRGRWLDRNIESLLQYCQESKNENIYIQ